MTSPTGHDLLKARLPVRSRHPRALLTLLEGVALCSGEPLYAVISAGKYREDWLGSEQWGEELWPDESALVQAAKQTKRASVTSPGGAGRTRFRQAQGRPGQGTAQSAGCVGGRIWDRLWLRHPAGQ